MVDPRDRKPVLKTRESGEQREKRKRRKCEEKAVKDENNVFEIAQKRTEGNELNIDLLDDTTHFKQCMHGYLA